MNHAGMVRGPRGEQAVAILAFFLLFPGFFFYHTLLGLGVMGAFLGGFFAPASLLVVLPLIYMYLMRIRREPNRLAKPDIAFGIYLAYFSMVVAANAALGGKMVHVVHHILGILFLLNVFLIYKAIDFSGRQFRRIALLSLLAMSAIVFWFSIDGVFYLGALGIAKDADSLATYQGFSRSYLFTFVPVIAYTRSPWLRILLYCIGAPTLFFNTARSEFIALLFLIPIIEFYHSKNKLVVAFIFLVLAVAVKIYLEDIIALLPHNRILELLDLSQSTSANKRHHLTVYAIQTINEHPFLGDFGSYPPGLYAHNVLSAWVDLGIVGIVFLLGMITIPAIMMFIREYFSSRNYYEFLLPFSLASITLLLLLTSHFFTDMLIGATLGCYSTYWYGRKHDKRQPWPAGIALQREKPVHQALFTPARPAPPG
ncbi:hypothetical protein ACFSQU_06970 [Massilia sp. GCM10020059]|uniref:O-antigen ligase domain-containing protein n=1 Tax=Massilia agrisoli TaxID=2892444 RepID=A0ABS8IWX5_9BURK|nr:hypothetical protein [Massilia agrisoli]MCC6072178.1 hypothetical protein [Massilia agrisoli]